MPDEATAEATENEALDAAMEKHGFSKEEEEPQKDENQPADEQDDETDTDESAEDTGQPDEDSGEQEQPQWTRRQREAARELGVAPEDLGDNAEQVLNRVAEIRSDKSRIQQGLPPKYASRLDQESPGESEEKQGEGHEPEPVTGDAILDNPDAFAKDYNSMRQEVRGFRAEIAELRKTFDEAAKEAVQDEEAKEQREIDVWFGKLPKTFEEYGDGPMADLIDGSVEANARNRVVERARRLQDLERSMGSDLSLEEALLDSLRKIAPGKVQAWVRDQAKARNRRRNRGSMEPNRERAGAGRPKGPMDDANAAMDAWAERAGVELRP
jgi:hypothetical protein